MSTTTRNTTAQDEPETTPLVTARTLGFAVACLAAWPLLKVAYLLATGVISW